MHWIYLLIAGFLEIAFASLLKMSDGFTKIWPIIGFTLISFVSLFFLTKAMKVIPLGTAYAIWTGIGAVGTVLIGIFFYDDPVNFSRIFFLSIIILSLVGLKLVS